MGKRNMHYLAIADTDIGNVKQTNRDSVLIKHGETEKGELASATVIRTFSKWFDEELPHELEKLDLQVIAGKWDFILKDLNLKISEYGQSQNVRMGTTFTGILFVEDKYIVVHVGDTRLYHLV